MVTAQPFKPPSVSVICAGAAFYGREVKAADVFRRKSLAVTGILALIGFGILKTEDHSGLTIAEDAERLRPGRTQIARLEGFKLPEFGKILTGLDDRRIKEAFALAFLGSVEDLLSAVRA